LPREEASPGGQCVWPGLRPGSRGKPAPTIDRVAWNFSDLYPNGCPAFSLGKLLHLV